MVSDLSPQAWAMLTRSHPKFIEKVQGVGKNRPRCEAKITLAATMTKAKERQISKARQEGRAPNECGNRSMWRINNRCYCQSHAGQEAINTLVMLANGGTL